MPLEIPKLQQNVPITEDNGRPSFAFHTWWDSVARAVQTSFNNLFDNLVALGLIKTDGTINTDKVTTDSLASNAATVPWLIYSDTTINFPSPGTRTDVLSVAIDKEVDESLLEVHGQLPLYALDSVSVVVNYEVTDVDDIVVASREFEMKVDGNNDTYLPFAYEHYFDAVDAGAYTVTMWVERRDANDCNTFGQYHMRVREFKR